MGIYTLKSDVLVFNNKKNIFYNLNFHAFFQDLIEAVKSTVEKYWELETLCTIQAVNDFKEIREEYLIQGIDFFSSQIKVENHNPVIIRISKEFVSDFMEMVLENKTDDFKLSDLTALEVKILNSFSEFLYKNIKEILIHPAEAKLSELSEKYVNFLFILNPKNASIGKIMLSVPIDRIPFQTLQTKKSFKDEDFLTSNTTVTIKIGSSKITLEDLENLSSDDIIILEDSNISYLTLISGELEQKFKVKTNPDLIVNLDEEGIEGDLEQNYEENDNEVTMEKNLWDDIQIEISAEFDKVKMTIGELKQITQGQIVDLGSVFNNEISLYVEEKKVAKGELIIINDRYAIRLHEVLSSGVNKAQNEPIPSENKKPAPPKKSEAPKKAPSNKKPEPKEEINENAVEDEEFDYSDFEK